MTHELDLNIRLSSASFSHRGRAVLATAIAGYEVESSWGDKHLMLVFKLLREYLQLLDDGTHISPPQPTSRCHF